MAGWYITEIINTIFWNTSSFTMLPQTEVQQSRENLIVHYFNCHLSYREILNALCIHHNINLSLRHLKRILCKLGLCRLCHGNNATPVADVKSTILRELQGSGQSLGYRAMWQRLKLKYGFNVRSNDVLEYLRELDPQGVSERKRKRMKRRNYVSPGPNFTWHLDGYDKLKPFGFCIHGAIDGYSRRILWLEVGPTNNNPKVIAHYYITCAQQLDYVPRLVRCDLGTENTTVAFLQPFLRSSGHDEFAGVNSFMYGKSSSNQRIEMWWSILRKSVTNWWINFFKDLRDKGMFDASDYLQSECLKFCFTELIRDDLNSFVSEWNLHSIYTQKNSECEKGKPDVMFYMPQMHGSGNYGNLYQRMTLRTVCKITLRSLRKWDVHLIFWNWFTG